MSDTGGPPAEPNATGFNNIGSIQGSVDIKLPEIDSAARSVALLVTHLQGLKSILQQFSSMTGSGLNSLLKQINQNAGSAAATVASLSGAVVGGGGGAGPSGGGSSGWANQATSQASQNIAQRMPGGIAAAGQYLKGTESLAGGMVMGGLRFLRDRIGTSRELSIQTGGQLGMVARQQGVNVEQMMNQMSQFPGSVLGTPKDLLAMFEAAPQLGASFDFGGNRGTAGGAQGPRAAGFFRGVREAQMMNPGESVSSIVGTIGGQAANVGAQQQSAFLTGGAFSMIAAGGRQKSIAEWAESVTRWLEGLRGGSKRGTAFTYGELMAQYFPGSNIDAWFQTNGVSPDMRTYWWTYALQKASKGVSGEMEITPDDSNVAWQRLRATSELTRTEFNLGGQMMGAFVNKEQANRWFNQLFGQIQTNLIPAFANSIGKFIEYLPDTIEELLMSGIEGIAAGDTEGDTAWVGDVDIGDKGTYGQMGGTGLAGLSPNMRSKLGPMMRANPRLRINSGLRDNAMQKRLKDQGHSRVSGKPSAHTRGDAADLGPPSQYGWLVKNAKRFGLKSGVGQGEPWHVGVGDPEGVGDAWDTFMDWMGNMGGSAEGVFDLVQRLLGGLFEKFSGGLSGGVQDTPERISSDEFYDNLINASKGGMTLGGPTAGLPPNKNRSDYESGTATMPGAPSGGGSTPVQPGAGGTFPTPGVPGTSPSTDQSRVDSTYTSFFKQVLGGLGVSSNISNIRKLGAVAKYEGGGGSFNPFNSTGGDFPNKFNSVGVENYPSWETGVQYTTKLLNQQNTAAMRANLQQQGSYADWRTAVTNFYKSWGGPPMPNISESSADAYLAKTVRGAGDVDEANLMSMPTIDPAEMMRYQAMPPAAAAAESGQAIQFHNTFIIGQQGGGGGGGIDVRRTVMRVADLLEDEMDRRLTRSN